MRLAFGPQIWGGVIGGLGLEEGNSAADFYASYYNDHVRGTQMPSHGRVSLSFGWPSSRLRLPVDPAAVVPQDAGVLLNNQTG